MKAIKLETILDNNSEVLSKNVDNGTPTHLEKVKSQRNNEDLLPQASSLAHFLLGEILHRGKVSYPIWLKRARDALINLESVLLRLPELEITNNKTDHHEYSEVCIELKREAVINPTSENLIHTPNIMLDAILNARDRSKMLYLVFSSQPAKYEGTFLTDPNLYTWFLNVARDFTQPTEIRLVSLSQAIIFSEEGNIEYLRHDTMAILREYHRDVNPISEYFKSFARKPTIRGREIE